MASSSSSIMTTSTTLEGTTSSFLSPGLSKPFLLPSYWSSYLGSAVGARSYRVHPTTTTTTTTTVVSSSFSPSLLSSVVSSSSSSDLSSVSSTSSTLINRSPAPSVTHLSRFITASSIPLDDDDDDDDNDDDDQDNTIALHAAPSTPLTLHDSSPHSVELQYLPPRSSPSSSSSSSPSSSPAFIRHRSSIETSTSLMSPNHSSFRFHLPPSSVFNSDSPIIHLPSKAGGGEEDASLPTLSPDNLSSNHTTTLLTFTSTTLEAKVEEDRVNVEKTTSTSHLQQHGEALRRTGILLSPTITASPPCTTPRMRRWSEGGRRDLDDGHGEKEKSFMAYLVELTYVNVPVLQPLLDCMLPVKPLSRSLRVNGPLLRCKEPHYNITAALQLWDHPACLLSLLLLGILLLPLVAALAFISFFLALAVVPALSLPLLFVVLRKAAASGLSEYLGKSPLLFPYLGALSRFSKDWVVAAVFPWIATGPSKQRTTGNGSHNLAQSEKALIPAAVESENQVGSLLLDCVLWLVLLGPLCLFVTLPSLLSASILTALSCLLLIPAWAVVALPLAVSLNALLALPFVCSNSSLLNFLSQHVASSDRLRRMVSWACVTTQRAMRSNRTPVSFKSKTEWRVALTITDSPE